MEKLKVGLIGMGRMGKRYAELLHYKIKHVELIAVSSISPVELDYAKQVMGINQVYSDYRQLLILNELDAVFIVSSTQQHSTHFIEALNEGIHVFCEKPLALNVDECLKVVKAAESKPSQISMVGFNRRFDKSYQYAKDKIDAGLIGKPIMVRSQTVDLDEFTGFQASYGQQSGGIFLDYNVHDIDLVRWYLGSDFATVYAMGDAYKHEVFAKMNDADHVMTVGRMENGTMCQIVASRLAAHGHDTYTEITGTEGSLRIGRPAGANLVEIYDKQGSRREWVKDFYSRFEEAFEQQIRHFSDAIINGKKLPFTLRDSVEATRVGVAMTKSFMMKKEIRIER